MLWTVVNFLILVAALIYFTRKPVSEGFAAKHKEVKSAIDEAEELRKSVETMVQEYQAKIARLDEEVAQIIQEAKSQGEKERRAILERAEKMAQKILDDAKEQAVKEREKLEAALRNETLKSAAEKAMAILQSKISEKDHKAFIQDLVKGAEEFHG